MPINWYITSNSLDHTIEHPRQAVSVSSSHQTLPPRRCSSGAPPASSVVAALFSRSTTRTGLFPAPAHYPARLPDPTVDQCRFGIAAFVVEVVYPGVYTPANQSAIIPDKCWLKRLPRESRRQSSSQATVWAFQSWPEAHLCPGLPGHTRR